MSKKLLLAIVIIIMIGIGAFLYATRPASAPTQDLQAMLETATTGQASANAKTYRISQSESKAEFRIDEVLRDKPFTAIGTTNQIAGDIIFTGEATSPISFSTIKINARTFKTDSENRDGATARFILKSEDPSNEFITFTPTSTSVPESIVAGGEVTGTVSGNLTISGVTKPATFTLKLKQSSDTISGTAITTLKRSDFDLKIPNVPFVASVKDTFDVSATIVAKAQ